jgi:hypothetical protein
MSSDSWDKSFCLEIDFLYGLTFDFFLTAGLGLEAALDLTDDLGLTAIVR